MSTMRKNSFFRLLRACTQKQNHPSYSIPPRLSRQHIMLSSVSYTLLTDSLHYQSKFNIERHVLLLKCSVNVLNLFDRTSRRHRSHGSRKYNKPEIHDVSFDGLLPFVNLQLGLHHIRTKLYSLPLKRLHALYESTLTLHFADVGSPGHRLQGIILDISSNRLFKAVRVG